MLTIRSFIDSLGQTRPSKANRSWLVWLVKVKSELNDWFEASRWRQWKQKTMSIKPCGIFFAKFTYYNFLLPPLLRNRYCFGSIFSSIISSFVALLFLSFYLLNFFFSFSFLFSFRLLFLYSFYLFIF